jgi:hypothetical protein
VGSGRTSRGVLQSKRRRLADLGHDAATTVIEVEQSLDRVPSIVVFVSPKVGSHAISGGSALIALAPS